MRVTHGAGARPAAHCCSHLLRLHTVGEAPVPKPPSAAPAEARTEISAAAVDAAVAAVTRAKEKELLRTHGFGHLWNDCTKTLCC
jgi:hypothetical protein